MWGGSGAHLGTDVADVGHGVIEPWINISCGGHCCPCSPFPHVSSCSFYKHGDSQDQMVSQVREKILNDLHSTKKLLAWKMRL